LSDVYKIHADAPFDSIVRIRLQFPYWGFLDIKASLGYFHIPTSKTFPELFIFHLNYSKMLWSCQSFCCHEKYNLIFS
jgi:hypothetical protein